MSKVRNISGVALDVPLLNRVVQPDDVVEVPDYQPDHSDGNPLPIIWPGNRWEPVTGETGVTPVTSDTSEDGAPE